MAKKLDLTGKKINHLTILRYAGLDKKKNTTWVCLCDCGQEVVLRGSSVKNGYTKSCGCLQKTHAAKTSKKNRTHGHSINGKTSKAYNSWTNMKSRCTNQNDPAYHNYGGRGITVCEQWLNSFENFFEDMGEPPTKHHSIDRIDNDGNYNPKNCRWTTTKIQNKNKRTNHLISFRGITQCVKDWSDAVGINSNTIKERLKRGWPIDKTLTTPTHTNQTKFCFNDILLIPRYSELESRKSPNISTKIGHLTLQIPIISAPMDTISSPEMLCAMSMCGGLGILTRYIHMSQAHEEKRQIEEIQFAAKNGAINIGCAIGIKSNAINHIKSLLDCGCTAICLDVAHGNHALMYKRIGEILPIKKHYKFTLIAGNICTPDGAIGLAKAGVDAIKVGIGSGAICTTRIVSGFGIPELSAILDTKKAIHNLYPKVSIIADGGIRQSGDMVKSLWAGADACMVGYILAGTHEAPTIHGKHIYRGMSSYSVSNRHDIAEEGVEIAVTNKGSVQSTVLTYAKGIKSGLAMGGVRNIVELREKVSHVVVSPLSLEETMPHNSEM